MSSGETGSPDKPEAKPQDERLSLDEFKRLIEEAQERGEDTGPILKRLVLQTIDEVQEGLEQERAVN